MIKKKKNSSKVVKHCRNISHWVSQLIITNAHCIFLFACGCVLFCSSKKPKVTSYGIEGKPKIQIKVTSKRDFTVGIMVKNLPVNAEGARDMSSIPGLGRSPGVGNGNPPKCSCLENSMDRGAWEATIHGVTKSWTQLSMHKRIHTHIHTHTHNLLKC